MKTFPTLALAAALTTAFAGAGFAQSGMMSDSDKAMMKKCEGMSKDAMQKDAKCMDLMKKTGASPGSQNKTMPSQNK